MRNLVVQVALFSSIFFVTESLAGDKEEVIADIRQSWKEFSLKNPATEWSHSEGAWVATSEGGLWQFWTAKEFNSMIVDSANILDLRPHHINVKFVGEKQDVAYAAYYLVGNILDSNRKVVVKNYRTRASDVLVQENGKWVPIGRHFSPLYGGSGVVFD